MLTLAHSMASDARLASVLFSVFLDHHRGLWRCVTSGEVPYFLIVASMCNGLRARSTKCLYTKGFEGKEVAIQRGGQVNITNSSYVRRKRVVVVGDEDVAGQQSWRRQR